MSNVSIEPWYCDKEDVHVHNVGSTTVSGYFGGLVNNSNVDTVEKIGWITGKLKSIGSRQSIDSNISQFCELVNELLTYPPKLIANSRKQLYGWCGSDFGLTDLEVSWLDYQLREDWAERAGDEDPWCDKMTLKGVDPIEIVGIYLTAHYPETHAEFHGC